MSMVDGEIESKTGNVSFDELMTKRYWILRRALQVELINSEAPLESIREEQEEIVRSVHDSELFFKKFSNILSPEQTPQLSKFLYVTAHLEEGLENDLAQEYKQIPEIMASAKALLFYFHYVDVVREALEANPNPKSIHALIEAPPATVEMAHKIFVNIQPFREAFVDFLKAGLNMATALHLDKDELYRREILEFSRLSAPDHDGYSLAYVNERLKTDDTSQAIDSSKLRAICQEIMRDGYGGILMSWRTTRYKYLAMALGIDDYVRYLRLLLPKKTEHFAEDVEGEPLIKLNTQYHFKNKIRNLYRQLTENDYLQCHEEDFLGLFGKQDGAHNPKRMVWKASQSSLFYFLFTLVKKYSDMNTMKIFVRVADEWFVKVEAGKQVSFSNAINYHSALEKYLDDRDKNYNAAIRLLPSKEHVSILNKILKTSLSS